MVEYTSTRKEEEDDGENDETFIDSDDELVAGELKNTKKEDSEEDSDDSSEKTLVKTKKKTVKKTKKASNLDV